MVDIQTISILIAAASVVLAMINSILANRRAGKTDEIALETRQMNNYLQFARESQTPEFQSAHHEVIVLQQWEDFNEWNEKYGAFTNPDAYLKFTRINEFFNTIGLLVKTGVIDENIPYEQGGDVILSSWRKVEPLVYAMRKDSPKLWSTFEYFAKRCEILRERDQTLK
jgi:hypothetical protein